MKTAVPRTLAVPLACGALLTLPAACVSTARMPLDPGCRVVAQVTGQSVRLVLDTGSPRIALTTAAAQRLSLPLSPTAATVADSTGLERPPTGIARLADFQLGTLSGSGEALCLPMPPAVGDGLLGMEVLQHGCWIFDLAGGVLCMTCGDLAEALLAQHGYRVVSKVGLVGDPLHPHLTVRLDDREDISLLLDTGAADTTLPIEAIARLGLPSGDLLARQQAEEQQRELQAALDAQASLGVAVQVTVHPDDGSRVGVHGVPAQTALHHLPRLAVGGITVPDVLVTAREREGALGRNVLRAFPWLLHGPRREFWVLTKP